MAHDVSHQSLRVAARLANGFALDLVKLGGFGRDVVDGLLLAAISQANVAQITRNPELQRRYATLDQPPPDELRRPDQSPWAILRNFVTSNLPGHDRSSWKRLQRKYAVRGIGMPGRVSMGAGRVGVVIDTSGSIGQDMLNLFASHMGAIITDAMPRDVKIYWVDAKLHRVDDAKNVTDLRRILAKKIPGGGGTDMRIGVAAAEKDKCDSIVVLTDGYTPFCDSKKPLMWAITSDVKAEGNGRTISI